MIPVAIRLYDADVNAEPLRSNLNGRLISPSAGFSILSGINVPSKGFHLQGLPGSSAPTKMLRERLPKAGTSPRVGRRAKPADNVLKARIPRCPDLLSAPFARRAKLLIRRQLKVKKDKNPPQSTDPKLHNVHANARPAASDPTYKKEEREVKAHQRHHKEVLPPARVGPNQHGVPGTIHWGFSNRANDPRTRSEQISMSLKSETRRRNKSR